MRWKRAPRLRPLIDLGEWLGDSTVLSFSIGPRGEAIVLAAIEADAAVALAQEVVPGWASFPEARAARPYEASLLVTSGDDVEVRRIDGLTVTFPYVQPLPGDELLVVGARSHRSGEVCDPNARVYGNHGSLTRGFLLGDGIEDVQTTEEGAIWVSYFDEGVFGNFGWGISDDTRPIGASGLARFDASGELLWEFEPPAGGEPIADCYALNVTVDAAWAYYYTPFALVRIADDAVESWDTPVAGARAFAIDGDSVSFVGDYEDRARCVECRFDDRKLVEARRFTLTTPGGKLPDSARVVARGPSIFAIDRATLYQLRLPNE